MAQVLFGLSCSGPATQTGMKITVRTAGGSCCKVAPGDHWTFRDLSREVEEKLDVPLLQQQLIHGHKLPKEFMRTVAIKTIGELLRIEGGPGMALELSLYIRSPEYGEALRAVERDWRALQYASEELKGDREVVMAAIKHTSWALEYASEELKGDREVVMAAVRQTGRALQYASAELKGDREVLMKAIKQTWEALQYASAELKGDREVVMASVRQNHLARQYASEELKGDREIVMEAVKQECDALQYAMRSCRAT